MGKILLERAEKIAEEVSNVSAMEEQRQKCVSCGINHRLTFFRKHRVYHGVMVHHKVCKECERKDREAKRFNDPDYMYKNKAHNSISKHAERNNMTFNQFCEAYDLSEDYIAYLFKKEWLAYDSLGLNCPSCRCRHTKKDPLTFEKLTLDRIDRNKGYWQSNIRIVCRTYNTGKGAIDPIDYDKQCRDYRDHEKAIKKGVQFDLPERKSKTTHMNTQLALL